MGAGKFMVTRADGRSNAQVVLDLVKGKPAGAVFTYEDIAVALSVGASRTYKPTEVSVIVSAAYPRLLKEQARALHNVRGVGYRLAPAAYHVVLANGRQSRADRQMLRGMQTLQNVRWDEMDSNQRLAHEGQLMITSALVRQMRALDKRQSAVEDAIRRARGGELFNAVDEQ